MVYLACILAYLLLLGGIAVWKSREVKDQSDFAVAGRSLSPWMMVCTMLAVWIGTGSIVGNAEQTYETGMAALLLPVGTLIGMALLALIATRVRTVDASTVPEILQLRFGPTSRNLAMLSLVSAYMVIVSYQFNAGGAVLEVIAGYRDPVPVQVGDSLSRDQLTRGRLRYTPDQTLTDPVQISVVDAASAAYTVTINYPLESDESPAEPAADDNTTMQLTSLRPTPIQFGRGELRNPRYELKALPSHGTVELVEPILSARTATIIAAVFITSYAAMAGLLSLAWMDLVTGTIIMVTMVVSFPIYYAKAGGMEGMAAAFAADGRSDHMQLWGVYSVVNLINFTLPVFLLVLGDANQYQRIFASRTENGARLAVIMMVFIAFAIEELIIGCAWMASSMTPDPENGRYILIYAARHYLILPLGCLFMVTVVAIIISTADSFLHVPATTVVNDLYLKYVNPDAPQRRIVFVSRCMVVLFGIVAYIVSLLFSESTGFFRKALLAFTIYGASVTPSLLAALVWKGATRQGAVCSILSGALVTLLWDTQFVSGYLPPLLRSLDAVLPAVSVSIAMLIGVSLLTSQAPGQDDQ